MKDKKRTENAYNMLPIGFRCDKVCYLMLAVFMLTSLQTLRLTAKMLQSGAQVYLIFTSAF